MTSKTLSVEFKKKLLDMKTENIKLRQRAVFIDCVSAPGEIIEFPEWKSFTKLQKIKKLNEYCKIHSIPTHLTLDNLSNYTVSNIVFCKDLQQVKSVNLSKK
jgi:hypothetical protein